MEGGKAPADMFVTSLTFPPRATTPTTREVARARDLHILAASSSLLFVAAMGPVIRALRRSVEAPSRTGASAGARTTLVATSHMCVYLPISCVFPEQRATTDLALKPAKYELVAFGWGGSERALRRYRREVAAGGPEWTAFEVLQHGSARGREVVGRSFAQGGREGG